MNYISEYFKEKAKNISKEKIIPRSQAHEILNSIYLWFVRWIS
jgi:hypothetical protein